MLTVTSFADFDMPPNFALRKRFTQKIESN